MSQTYDKSNIAVQAQPNQHYKLCRVIEIIHHDGSKAEVEKKNCHAPSIVTNNAIHTLLLSC